MILCVSVLSNKCLSEAEVAGYGRLLTTIAGFIASKAFPPCLRAVAVSRDKLEGTIVAFSKTHVPSIPCSVGRRGSCYTVCRPLSTFDYVARSMCRSVECTSKGESPNLAPDNELLYAIYSGLCRALVYVADIEEPYNRFPPHNPCSSVWQGR